MNIGASIKNFQRRFYRRLTGLTLVISGMLVVMPVFAREYHVAVGGNDGNEGSLAKPFRTIQHAVSLAQPGDVVTIHQGVYRERVNPLHGGLSDRKRIIYQSAPGERVEIKGSEVITNWVKVQDNVWQATLPNAYFGRFNPYRDLIHGDWFDGKNRKHHTGAVYLNGEWLMEAAQMEDVWKSVTTNALWFGKVDDTNTTIWAQFKGVNPNEQLVEINVRQTVFYPEKTGVNFITVRGFTMRHAATPWAPPTAEQIGLIGTHWSKGWIIESNVISHSVCAGITLGKYGDEWDNRAESAEGYVGTIVRALTNGWNAETIGHHLVRNNEISYCEQAGIVGSLGGAFSTISGNDIHDIHVRRLFKGAEMAGIKLHGAVDVEISGNHIYRTCRGIWLDWMAQGTRVSRNFFHDNSFDDLFTEVDHGPYLVDNNLFLSPTSLRIWSQGGAYVHNLIAGKVEAKAYDARQTPYLKPHSTALAGLHDNPRGDQRFYNNLLMGRVDLSQFDESKLPVRVAGNLFLGGASPSRFETNAIVQTNFVPTLKISRGSDGWFLTMRGDTSSSHDLNCQPVTTKSLGRAVIPDAAYENPDGSPIKINTDYQNKIRKGKTPSVGPFADASEPNLSINVWPETK